MHHKFKEYLGFQPKIFRPPFGGIDHRSHALLESLGYTIIQWSAGCNDWWFTDNEKDLETSIAALRYTLAEAGGVVCMHDKAQEPNNGERLRKVSFVQLVTSGSFCIILHNAHYGISGELHSSCCNYLFVLTRMIIF